MNTAVWLVAARLLVQVTGDLVVDWCRVCQNIEMTYCYCENTGPLLICGTTSFLVYEGSQFITYMHVRVDTPPHYVPTKTVFTSLSMCLCHRPLGYAFVVRGKLNPVCGNVFMYIPGKCYQRTASEHWIPARLSPSHLPFLVIHIDVRSI